MRCLVLLANDWPRLVLNTAALYWPVPGNEYIHVVFIFWLHSARSLNFSTLFPIIILIILFSSLLSFKISTEEIIGHGHNWALWNAPYRMCEIHGWNVAYHEREYEGQWKCCPVKRDHQKNVCRDAHFSPSPSFSRATFLFLKLFTYLCIVFFLSLS